MTAKRVDANQPEIVRALRDVGAGVTMLHAVGGGCPDLLVGFRGTTYVLEVKDGAKPPSERRLTTSEDFWHTFWPGQVAIVTTVDEALRAIGAVE